MLERILSRLDSERPFESLVDDIKLTDLQSLMLEVYRRRAARLSPAQVLQRYRDDRFVKPSPQDPRTLLEFDRIAFAVADEFEPIELSPLCPLSTVGGLGTVDQNNVVSTVRNSEVVADSTNVMALECAIRRQAGSEVVRLCSSHRVVRAQFFDSPNSWAHFKLFGLCTAGRDRGSFGFEAEALSTQLRFYLRLFGALREAGYSIHEPIVRLTDFCGLREGSLREITERVRAESPESTIFLEPNRESGRGYYREVCFQIHVRDSEGVEQFLVDGGLTDWTQKLLSNNKERLLISGVGTERVCHLFAPRMPQ